MENNDTLEARRRRLLFRANHRGTRENDILIGGFVAARLEAFTPEDVAALEVIMELPDSWLSDWLMGRAPIPAQHDVPMLRAMRDACARGPAL
jgi:antitoxin CptB